MYQLEVMNCKEDADPAHAVANKANQIQSSMELSQGPLMKLGLFKCADGDHLLIAIHHLVIDGVSGAFYLRISQAAMSRRSADKWSGFRKNRLISILGGAIVQVCTGNR